MAKGDDYKIKKKNKAIRKKLSKDSSSTSARVASLIAAKKRRQSGKRRKCQGMCFSLPTPEDPFNDGLGKENISSKKIKKRTSKDITNKRQKEMLSDDQTDSDTSMKTRLMSTDSEKEESQSLKMNVGVGCPSKFLCGCLDTIRQSLLGDGVLDEEHDLPLFVYSWGIGLWKSYVLGNDFYDKSGSSASILQMAWIGSIAADHITQKEDSGVSLTTPVLLYLVPSQERANEVRSVFKPLKYSGVLTVSVHPDTSIENQIQGLRNCEPEFLIATPERLKELVLLKAVDISGVSLLVVDSVDTLCPCFGAVSWIKKTINGNPRTVVFQGYTGKSYNEDDALSILHKPFHTISVDEPENFTAI